MMHAMIKCLFFSLLIFSTQTLFAQKGINYEIISKKKNVVGNSTENYFVHVRKVNKKDNLYELQVRGMEVYNNGNFSSRFSTVDPDTNFNFLNTSDIITHFYLLKNPVQFSIDSGHVKLNSARVNEQIQQQLNDWQINQDAMRNSQNNIYVTMKLLTSRLYFDYSGNTDLKADTFQRGKMNYQVLDRNKSTLTVTGSLIDSTSKIANTIQLSLKDYTIIKSTSDEDYTYEVDGSKLTDSRTTSVMQVKDEHRGTMDRDYIDMVLMGGYWSTALKTDGDMDSIKFVQFCQKYEPKFQQNKNFVDIQLSGLQSINDYQTYYTKLKTTPVTLIAGTHHIANALSEGENKDETFYELIDVTTEDQLYGYVQNNLYQHVRQYAKDENITNTLQLNFVKNNTVNRLPNLAKSNKERIKTATIPLSMWYHTQSMQDTDSIKNAINEIINLENIYWKNGNVARYALLLYQDLSQKNEQNPETLLSIIDKLTTLYQDENNTQRLVHRAHLTYANFLASEVFPDQKIAYLEKAALFSPKSREDMDYNSSYDRMFLKSKENYNDDYLQALVRIGKSDIALTNYVKEFLINPSSSFEKLQKFYKEHVNQDFATYFKQTIVPQLQDAPTFALQDMKDQPQSLEQFKGKWTVVDFWGTWCVPCVNEMPKLNEYYKKLDKRGNIDFITIACYDTKEKVQNFISKNNYEIPALLSDSKVQQDYKVKGYPSKFIITPEGKLISTTFGSDWQRLVDQLSKL